MLLLVIAYLGFVSLGLPDAASGVAWPSLRDELGVGAGGLGVLLIGVGIGYIASAALGGKLQVRYGVANLLTSSTLVVALGLALFALAPRWSVLLMAAPIVGLGSGAIDAALNAFASRSFSARHMIWLHACYGIGATIGPLIMTRILTADLSWRFGYAALAGLQLVAAVVFAGSRRRVARAEREQAAARHAESAASGGMTPCSAQDALRSPLVWGQVLFFLCYAGLESAVGQWSFTLQKEGGGASTLDAGLGTTGYWASLTAGRFLTGFIAERAGPVRLVRGATFLALAGCALFAMGDGEMRIAGLVLIGLGLAPIYPAMMSATPARLGPDLAVHAVGWQVAAAMAGVLFLPGGIALLIKSQGVGVVGIVAFGTAVLLLALHESLIAAFSAKARS